MTMGEKIKQLRSANGFTQEMLAEKMRRWYRNISDLCTDGSRRAEDPHYL